MNESSALRSVSINDGRMAIEGLSTRFVQGSARRLRLKATGLRFVGGFESRDGRLQDGRRILAEAHVLAGNLWRAGADGDAGTIGLTLRPLAASSDQPRLLLLLGYREEAGAETPFAEAFLAPTVFEALKADMLAGLAQEIELGATTNLWVREEDRARADEDPLDWYLAPGPDGRAIVPARGFIESIEWRPQDRSEPATAAASAVQTAVAHDPDEDWPESSAEQLRKINWSFKLLLLLLAFLMIIIAVK